METSYTKLNKTNPNEEEEVDINEVPSNLSIIPLENDFAVCELCGFVGIRTYFYARDNKYCSLRCYVSKTRRRYFNCKFKVMGSTEHMADMIPLEPLPQLQHWTGPPTDLQAGPLKPSQHIVPNSYEWSDELFGFDFLAAPVSLFKHAPLHDMWDNTFEGMKVEVKNTDGDGFNNKPAEYFWVATVIKVKGYMGLLRYEGFGSDDSKDFWVNLCCSEIHPVGWCATRGKPLIPPKSIEDKYSDWKRFLVKQLTGARTLPVNFYTKLAEHMKSRFSVGNFIEVVNKNRISQLKLATIHEIIGKRLHIKYYNAPADDIGFWCHEDSPLIHPVGWAYTVGHPIDAPETYCLRVATGRSLPDDSTPDMFFKFPTNEPPLFSPGMMLEAIDPLNLSSLCTATVTRILNDGYMMIRIDCYPEDPTGSDWFCYHQRSPCIFPVGFAMANNIPLIPPNGWSAESFTWEACLASRGCQAAPARLFAPRPRVLGFAAGMRLECADLMDPRLICVATVNRVVANMLKITFDGWNSEFDQWLWAHSTDMYPVGWARAVGLRLEGPHALPAPRPQRMPKPKPPRVPRRRRRAQLPTAKDDSQASEQSGYITSSSHTTHTGPPSTHTSPPSTLTSPTFSTCSLATTFSVSVSSPATAFSASVSSPSSPISTCLANVASPSIITNVTSPGNSGSVTSPMQCLDQREEVNGILNHQNDMDDSSAVPESSSTEPLSTETDESADMDGQKLIPRLIDDGTLWDRVNVDDWETEDVAKFLIRNDCQPYCENFCNITGSHLLELSKDEIIELLEMKVGPSLKIYDLIQQLKFKVKPQCKLNNGK